MAADIIEIVGHSLDLGSSAASALAGRLGSIMADTEFKHEDLIFQEESELEKMFIDIDDQVAELPHGPFGTLMRRLVNEASKAEKEGKDVRPQTVMLEGVNLKYDRFLLLVYYLTYHPITAISLIDCGLTPKHCIALAYAIRYCPNLGQLNLANNPNVGDKGVAAISLAIFDSRKDKEGGTGIKKISLDGCNISDSAGYIGKYIVKYNESLEMLDLSSNKLGPKACKEIGNGLDRSGAITLLDLHSNKVGDEGCAFIMEALEQNNLRNLKKVFLGHNGITSESGEFIGKALKSAYCLYELRLGHNKLKDEGVMMLAHGLATEDAQLVVLNLNGNGIGDDGMEALGCALIENNSLSELRLADNKISSDGLVSFCSSLGAPEIDEEPDIVIDDCETEEEREKKMGFAEMKRQRERVEAYSAKNKLRILDLSRNKIGDQGAIELGHLLYVHPYLERLELEANVIENAGAIGISRGLRFNTKLEELNLSRNRIGNEGGSILAVYCGGSQLNTTLKSLSLDENPISKTKMINLISEDSQIALNITLDGTGDASQTLSSFGIRIANAEARTKFSQSLLVSSVLTNWFDLITDVLVVLELYNAAKTGFVSYIWFGLSISFLCLPTLYVMLFMSYEPGHGFETTLKNMFLSLIQLRVAYEAKKSLDMAETSTRFVSLRIVEAAGESGPQSLLQLSFLLHSAARTGTDVDISNITLLTSVSLSLLVLGQTFSDLFEKDHIMRSTGANKGFRIFMYMLPCLILHIAQFAFRAFTVAILTTIINPFVAVGAIAVAILWRFFIRWYTNSTRGKLFAILVTFFANSAWDKSLAVKIGFVSTFVEAAIVVGALWLTPNEAIFDTNPLWASNIDFTKIDAKFVTIGMASLFVIYAVIFIFYVFPKHEYDLVKETLPEDLAVVVEMAQDIHDDLQKEYKGKKAKDQPDEDDLQDQGSDDEGDDPKERQEKARQGWKILKNTVATTGRRGTATRTSKVDVAGETDMKNEKDDENDSDSDFEQNSSDSDDE